MDELDIMLNNQENDTTQEAPIKEKKARKPRKKKETEKKPPRDNIGRIEGMTSISDVRKALQIAIAKKAKAAGKPETQARYELEVECARKKLDTLLSENTTISALIAAGEEPNKVITSYIKDQESKFEDWLNTTGYKVSKRVMRAFSEDIPESFFNELPVEIHDALVTRHGKTDYRLWAACRKGNLMNAVAKGEAVYHEGKWKTADGTFIGVEAKATTDEEVVEEVESAE